MTDLSMWKFGTPKTDGDWTWHDVRGPGRVGATLTIFGKALRDVDIQISGPLPPDVYAELLRRAGVTP